MKLFLRTLVFGLVAGALLSAMRAPLGLDLVQSSAVLGTTAALYRAAALLALALTTGTRRAIFREHVDVPALLCGATLGYALHGLFVLAHFEPASRLAHGAVLVGATFLLFLVAGRARRTDAVAPPTPGQKVKAARTGGPDVEASRVERVGLVVCGLGAAVAFEHLARHVRLFGMGLPEDDTVIGLVVLAALASGALAFGRALLPGPAFLAPGLALGAAATWLGLRLLGGMKHDELYRYLDRFGFDYLMLGMLQVTAVLSGAAFVLSGFIAGTALHGAARGGRLPCVLFGAALGVLLFPYLVQATVEPLRGPEIFEHTWAWKLFALGTSCAAVGGFFAALGLSGKRRGAAFAFSALALAVPWAAPRPVTWVLSPWFPIPIEPALAVHAPEGFVTVEPERGTSFVVTVDRLRVTPTVEEEAVDAARLSYAWSLLDPELRASGRARVLFVGQLTPPRRDVLAGLGEMQLARTAPWASVLADVEATLFEGWKALEDQPIHPSEARRRIAAGDFDLVIAPPVIGPIQYPKSRVRLEWTHGPAPVVGWSVPRGTLAVVWVDAAAPLAERRLTERVCLAMDGFLHLSLGLLSGEVPTAPAPGRPALFPTGEAGARVGSLKLLLTRPKFRSDQNRRDLIARLRHASRGSALEDLATGLALHYGAQVDSSPFETVAQQVELDDEELLAFDRAVRAVAPAPLDAFTRSIWESLAWLFSEKRLPDKALVHLEPLAEAYAPWPVLDRAVARGYQEFDERADAARILTRLVESEPGDIALLVEAGEWSSLAGEHARAIDFLRRANALQPGRYDLRRSLGWVLLRAGEPEGRELIEELARENPEDGELLDWLRAGPGEATGGDFLPPPGDHPHDG